MNEQPNQQQQSTCKNISLKKIYQFALNNLDQSFKIKEQLFYQGQLLINLWAKAFKYTDPKTIQYSFLSLFLGWSIFTQQKSKKNLKQSKIFQLFFQYLQKACMYFLKFSDRIKQSQTFSEFIKLMKLIKTKYYTSFKCQLSIALKKLNQSFNLAQTVNFKDIFQHVWQKIIISQLVCLSKNFINQYNQSLQVLNLLKQLQKCIFLERLINCSRNYRFNKQKYTFSINPQQLQYLLITTMINIWINLSILSSNLDHKIYNQQSQKNKYNYEDFKQIIVRLKQLIWQNIQILTKRQISVLLIRSLIKHLNILNINHANIQWRQIFYIMSFILKEYSNNRNIIQFQDDSSYISKKFNPNLTFPFCINLKVKGQSIPFKQEKILIQFYDNSNKQKIWITMRNYDKNLIILNAIILQKDMIISKEQKQFKWNQFTSNKIQIILKNNKIKIILNQKQTLQSKKLKKNMSPIIYPNQNGHFNCENVMNFDHQLKKVQQIVLCDRQTGMGSTISQLIQFKLTKFNIFQENQKSQIDLIALVDNQKKDSIKFHKCQRIYQNSLIHYVQILGDMDLFILILSHTLKKIKKQDQIIEMIRGVLDLMHKFTIYQNVKQKELSHQDKDIRRNSILCLCWFFAKQTKSVIIIFQLMRFLYIRGHKQTEQMLKFLCNFSYWRQFKLQHQMLLVMKIRQIMKQATAEQQKLSNLYYCKKLLFDMVLFLKQSDYIAQQRDTCLKIHQLIYETIYQQIKDILQAPIKKDKLYFLQVIKFIEYLINLISCVLNRKVSQDIFNLTFSIQLTLFLKEIGKLLFTSKQKKHLTKNDIDLTLQDYFKKKQKQFFSPLSLNNQDAQDQRFAIFLTKIVSQTKSLITLFETQTYYIYESQAKIYPIYSETMTISSENKVVPNLLNFNIYIHMLTQKSWNYLLFNQPIEQYRIKTLQILWRTCFYELFKQKKYIPRLIKMLEQTPLPQNQYCLIKIFQVLLFSANFEKNCLLRLIKNSKIMKNICPLKLQSLLIKYLNRIQPEYHEKETENEQNEKSQIRSRQKSIQKIAQEQKIYFILFHNNQSDYFNNQQIIQCLKTRKFCQKQTKIVFFHLILKSLVKYINKNVEKKTIANQTNPFSSIQFTNLSKKNDYFNNSSSNVLPPKSFDLSIQKSNDETISQTSISDNLESYNFINSHLNKKQINQMDLNFINLSLQTLNFYLNQFTIENLKSFLKMQSRQDIQLMKQNFMINVDGVIKCLANLQQNILQTYNNELFKYLNFIEVYLIKFSQHLIYNDFPQFKIDNFNFTEQLIKKNRNKYLYKTIHIDLIKNSTDFFLQIMQEKRIQLHMLEQVWNRVEKKNIFFWNLFINSQKYYFLSDITTFLGERLLLTITNQKPKVQLPKMISKQSILHSVSIISQKNQLIQQIQSSATFFEQSDIYIPQMLDHQLKDKQRIRKGSNNYKKQMKRLKFKVLLVKNDKIYQGFLYLVEQNQFRFQQSYIIDQLYDRICAHQKQRRTDHQVEKDPKIVDIYIGQNTEFFLKKYLFYNVAMEIVTYQKFHFFCFDSQKRRNKFCSFYLNNIREKVITENKAKKQLQLDSIKWTKGLLTNYEYLLKINKYANRSPNDLSQYFIMPWTISQFQKKQIDVSYFFKSQNFRDLSKPLGKIDEKKWKHIQTRFKNSFSHIKSNMEGGIGLEPFLYGSFYSNPAIVTNYMIRLQPFSSLHFHLQSQKIDVADRLFFQFSDQYRSIKTNVGDVKQLIPQFYNNPQFLKNRQQLNLGRRQNKQIVHDVKLPSWAQNPYEFSPLVTKQLNSWINLTFGKYTKKQFALDADNLYMSEIYGPKQNLIQTQITNNNIKSKTSIPENHKLSKNSSLNSSQNRIPFNKEFGQIPFRLFDKLHPQFQMNEDYFFFKGKIENLIQFSHEGINESVGFSMNQNYFLITRGRLINLFEILNSQNGQKQTLKNLTQTSSNSMINDAVIISGQKLSSQSPYLFYVKKQNQKVYFRWIKRSKIFNSLQIKDQIQLTNGNTINWIGNQVLVVSHKNVLKIYNFLKNAPIPQGGKISQFILESTKSSIQIRQFPIFTQHKSKIILIQVNNDLKMIVTLDQMNKVFLLKYNPDKIQLINNFQIKSCHFEEQIIKVLVHKMSLIIFWTNYDRLLVYNYYGDMIGAKQIVFSLNDQKIIQKATCLRFFNNQSSQLIVGTNIGNIWKIDLFQFLKYEDQIKQKSLWFQRIKIPNKNNSCLQVKNILIKRWGRHWQIYSISLQDKNKFILHKIRCLTLKSSFFQFLK